MNTQVSAFLTRSLRQESRLVSHHVLRAVLAGFVFAIFLVRVLTVTLRSGAGANFALDVLRANYWFVTLLGGIYFSTTIVEEKEEQTLPLLRMTGATPASILLGKSIPRLACVLLFLLVITPFLFLSVTLGGLLMQGMLTASLGILAYAVMYSQVGLLASVISRDAQRALGRTLFIWALLEFLPTWSWLLSEWAMFMGEFRNFGQAREFLSPTNSVDGSWVQYLLAWLTLQGSMLSHWSESMTLHDNLSTYVYSFGSEPIWRPQMTAHLLLACGLFAVSWLLFERCTAVAVAQSIDSPQKVSRKTRRRVGRYALMWKSWQHITGGWLWFWLRLFGAPLLVVAIAVGISAALDEGLEAGTVGLLLLLGGGALLIGHITILFGRLFSDEINRKTLSSLLMLPLGRHSLLLQKIAGLLPAIAAAASCSVIGFVILYSYERSFRDEFYDMLLEPWFWQVIAAVFTTIALGLLFSVRLRYGGMLLAIVGVWMMSPFVFAGLFEVMYVVVGRRAANNFFEYALPWLLFQVEIPLCIWIHFRILRALNKAGELS